MMIASYFFVPTTSEGDPAVCSQNSGRLATTSIINTYIAARVIGFKC